jgi:hypothetical protein
MMKIEKFPVRDQVPSLVQVIGRKAPFVTVLWVKRSKALLRKNARKGRWRIGLPKIDGVFPGERQVLLDGNFCQCRWAGKSL